MLTLRNFWYRLQGLRSCRGKILAGAVHVTQIKFHFLLRILMQIIILMFAKLHVGAQRRGLGNEIEFNLENLHAIPSSSSYPGLIWLPALYPPIPLLLLAAVAFCGA
jgi:hypothetical protein